MKLLIIDDSLIMRKAVERSLSEKNFTVDFAGDGQEGLRLFKEKLPDLVTLDISMPKMDGITCLTEMLKVKKDAKILMITSQTDKVTSQEVLAKGAAGVLGKPFTTAQILEKINEILG